MDTLDLPGTAADYHSYMMREFDLDGCPCKVVAPAEPLPGRRWVWKAEYFDAFPAFELEMLKRGHYFAFMQLPYEYGSPRSLAHWDVFYRFLTEEHGFDRLPILFGLSVGGLYIYNWAAKHPDKVGCLYADNPVCDFKSWPHNCRERHSGHWKKLLAAYGFKNDAEAWAWQGNPVDNLAPLIAAKIPLIHAVAVDDTTVPVKENTDVLEKNCRARGGNITVFRHPGEHWPHHAVDNFSALCDLVERSARR